MKKISCVLFLLVGLVAGCATAPKENPVPDFRDSDPMIAQLSATARKAYDMGEVPRAVVMYRRALERARAMDNSREIGRNAHNLAVCLVSLDEYDEAAKLLVEAERETIRAGDDAGPIFLLSAEVARHRKDYRTADAIIDRLERLPVGDRTRGLAYVLRAHLACDRQDASRAEGFLYRAIGHLRRIDDPGLAASISEVAGRIAILKGNWLEAAREFDREAAWLHRAGRSMEMAAALERAGQNYMKIPQIDLAADRFYRSARSLMAQGAYLDALRVIEQAVQSTDEKHSDSETAEAIARLFEDIRQSVEKSSRVGLGSP
ncbi:MAG TPA: hypothetical protein PJ991_06615 [Kiritimatiellia bacterium]|nr:hypothetical protein [Kiritimatiellia bacterium]